MDRKYRNTISTEHKKCWWIFSI